jgi:hypothetical protein
MKTQRRNRKGILQGYVPCSYIYTVSTTSLRTRDNQAVTLEGFPQHRAPPHKCNTQGMTHFQRYLLDRPVSQLQAGQRKGQEKKDKGRMDEREKAMKNWNEMDSGAA